MHTTYFYILIRGRDAFDFFDTCIDSVVGQHYKNYIIIFCDDCSNYTHKQQAYIRQKLQNHIAIFNKTRKFSVRNAYDLIHTYATKPKAVVVSLDADDWLANADVLSYLDHIYRTTNCLATYGNCLLWNGKDTYSASSFDQYANTAYPPTTRRSNSYRKEPFRPLHVRTWRVDLFKKIKPIDLQQNNGEWLHFCEDQAIFFPILEMCGPKCLALSKPLYVYNVANKHQDLKTHSAELIKTEIIIRRKQPYEQL